MSQAEFVLPNRRVVNLARIGLMFADLDYYHSPDWRGLSPERVADSVVWYCLNEANLPEPSIIISSGRGLQVKWLLDGTIPRAALPRWNACQTHIVNSLKHFAADPQAKDASRVLRLVNTVNSKSGEICRVIHVKSGLDGSPVRYGFEELCENLLPYARWELEEQRIERESKRPRIIVSNDIKRTGLQKFNRRQLAWHRMEDLRTLRKMRGEVVPKGQRMKTLFWSLNFMALSGQTSVGQLHHEAKALATEIDPDWRHNPLELKSLYDKCKAYNSGARIEFNGKETIATLHAKKTIR